MLLRKAVAILTLITLGGLVAPVTVVHADEPVNEDELSDIATPGQAPVDNRPSPASASPPAVPMLAAATDRANRFDVDDFVYDELVLEGTAREVCAGRLLQGSGWAYTEIVQRFGGTPGTMYYCRERWDAANDPDCNGTIANPVTNPNFSSTCWSNHARGRAIDVMVGRQGSGYNRQRGINIVNWLLAPDGYGNVNANARKLGIQQILFADRCWNSDGDRGITSWARMRECGIGHHDHVHMDMTLAGANGTVSYWGAAPLVSARLDTQIFWDRNTAWRQAISWWNLRATDEEGLAVPAKYDRMYVGDFDADGLEDETFLFDHQTGDWVVQNWNDGDSLNARIGRWSRNFDEFVVGDWDGDGFVNDIIAWDRDSGNYGVQTFVNYEPRGRGSGYWSPGYEMAIAADLDGDGRRNDHLLWDKDTGKWAAFTWNNFRPTYRALGYWGRSTELAIVGDFSAGGDHDDILLWDRDAGAYVVQHWEHFRPVSQVSGRGWSTAYDIGSVGDYDSDGRADDIFVYDAGTGMWAIYSFHRNVATLRISQDWLHGYDSILAGSFLD